jgi:hypothetical protein
VTTVRQSDQTHRIMISKEIDLHTTGRETEDCVRGIETINAHISATIEQYPSQWVWMHRRWNRRPEDEKYRDIPNIERYETGNTEKSNNDSGTPPKSPAGTYLGSPFSGDPCAPWKSLKREKYPEG